MYSLKKVNVDLKVAVGMAFAMISIMFLELSVSMKMVGGLRGLRGGMFVWVLFGVVVRLVCLFSGMVIEIDFFVLFLDDFDDFDDDLDFFETIVSNELSLSSSISLNEEKELLMGKL